MGFTVFRKRDALASREPRTTILRSGSISLNRAALGMLTEGTKYADVDGPVAVELMYDKERKIIGIRVAEDKANSYPLRHSKGTSVATVSARAFLAYFGIGFDETRRYSPAKFDGIFGVDLNGEYDVVGRKKNGARKTPKQSG